MDSISAGRASLLSEELRRFVDIVVDDMNPEQIMLYGSLVSGNVGEWSDLDLVVVAESDVPFFERIKRIIANVRPRVGMDIVVYTPQEWDEVSKRLFVMKEILGNGRIVYERPQPVV